jgi:asparagine synthase (glutamine-hydrolysing)
MGMGRSELDRATRLELASGLCFGEVERRFPDAAGLTPLEALEQALLPGLARPPCLVAFSGGRDSSVVLAAAMSAARRHGLEPPIPATLRFAAAPLSHEVSWQETVVRHVGASDWIRLDIGHELEYLGAIGTRTLTRHGVLWPPNAFLLTPLLERAGDGSVVTGTGGDQFLTGGTHGRIRGVVGGRIRPEARDARRLAAALAPIAARRAVRRMISPARIPWLRPEAQREALAATVRDFECEPVRFDARVRFVARRRGTVESLRTGERLAGDARADLVTPLSDERFLAALADAGGARGWASRSALLRALFSGLLPGEVLTRSTKADFSEVVWGPRTREFIADWSGAGADSELVDAEALKAAWSEASPIFPAAIPLQVAWLRGAGKNLQHVPTSGSATPELGSRRPND